MLESIRAESEQALQSGDGSTYMRHTAGYKSCHGCAKHGVGRISRGDDARQEWHTCNGDGDNTMVMLEHATLALRRYLPYAQSKENHELNLLGSLHLQLPHDRDGQSEKNHFSDNLIHNRESQHYDPVDAFCGSSRLEIPDSGDRYALPDSKPDEW